MTGTRSLNMQALLAAHLLLIATGWGGVGQVKCTSDIVAFTRFAREFALCCHIGVRSMPCFISLCVPSQEEIRGGCAFSPGHHIRPTGTVPWQCRRLRPLRETCMFAHNPQKKGAKRWNQYRPKKVLLWDFLRVVFGSKVFTVVDATGSPKYLRHC